MGVLLISHDLSVVAERCESISVMRQGVIVEAGTSQAVLNSPRHPFTAELVGELTRVADHRGRPARSPPAGAAGDPIQEPGQ
jgi:peptide/nickel transport system ATP-binding protein